MVTAVFASRIACLAGQTGKISSFMSGTSATPDVPEKLAAQALAQRVSITSHRAAIKVTRARLTRTHKHWARVILIVAMRIMFSAVAVKISKSLASDPAPLPTPAPVPLTEMVIHRLPRRVVFRWQQSPLRAVFTITAPRPRYVSSNALSRSIKSLGLRINDDFCPDPNPVDLAHFTFARQLLSRRKSSNDGWSAAMALESMAQLRSC